MTSLNDFPLGEGTVCPTGEFKQSLYSFYVTDSALNDTNIGRNCNVIIKMTSFNDFPLQECQLVQLVSLNKFLTVSMIQIVLYVLLT